MGRRVIIEIPGKPIGKGRPKFSRQGNFVRTYTPEKTVSYENFVRYLWMQSGEEKMVGPLKATIYAFFKIPQSVSKKKRKEMMLDYYTHKPDADNIAKSILDGLSGVAMDDDSQVARIDVHKHYSEDERVFLILEEAERPDMCSICDHYVDGECNFEIPFSDTEQILKESNAYGCRFWEINRGRWQ